VYRAVKRSSDLRTLNFMFEFVFVFQPFDIRIQASLIRRRRFCLESGALQRCAVWRFLCSLPAVSSSDAHCMFAYTSPPFPAYRHGIQLISVLHCTVPLASYQSDKSWWPRHRADISRARHGLTFWLIALLIDCFPACGVSAVTFISLRSADIKRKLLKLLHKYVNRVRI